MSFDRYRDWFEEAIDDFEAAQILLEMGKWSKACFFSHQAVEKALKALLIKKLGVYRHTHSVAALINEISSRIALPNNLAKLASKLDRYYIPTRYPSAWPSLPPHKHYSRSDAEEAVRIAYEVINFVKRTIETDS